MKIGIPLLSTIDIFQCSNDSIYLPLDPLFELIDLHSKSHEIIFRKKNFRRACASHLITHNNIPHIELGGLIGYCYSHRNKLTFCAQVCTQVEQKLCPFERNDASYDETVLGIYRKIADFNFHSVSNLSKWTLDQFEVDKHSIPTLFDVHKGNFTTEEWKRICLFELNFSREYKVMPSLQDSIHQRQEYLQRLFSARQFVKCICDSSETVIRRRKLRKALSDNNKVELYFTHGSPHLPAVVEDDLESHLHSLSDQTFLVAILDCPKQCRSQNHGAHVFVECKSEAVSEEVSEAVSEEQCMHMCTLITSRLQARHKLPCYSVVFFRQGTFASISDTEGTFSRFSLQDKYNERHLDDKIYFKWESDQLNEIDETDERCSSCHQTDACFNPLHWAAFQVEEEFVSDVPLEVQMLLMAFIRKGSLSKCQDFSGFVRTKVVRLYALYDSLLNIGNKNHVGIFQELNTSQLMVNYHNLKDTFQMTNQMGLTTSFDAAERQWKQQATNDLCYFNYAIKKQTLTYPSAAGVCTNNVSLRDCFVIMMRDNLVTLTQKHDPEPGESRSGQICTIQGTDIGIPLDSAVFDEIHAENNCDGYTNCSCTKPVKLSSDKLQPVLLTCNTAEQEQMTALKQLCSWGLQAVWKHVHSSELLTDILLSEPISNVDHGAGNSDDDGGDDVDALEVSPSQLGVSGVLVNTADMGNDDIDLDLHHRKEIFSAISQGGTPSSKSECHEQQDLEIDSNLELTLNNDKSELAEATDYLIGTSASDEMDSDDQAYQMGFHRYIPPPFIMSHTAPYIGRDDDPKIIKHILDDFQTKTQSRGQFSIIGVDQKIGACHMKLERANPEYRKIVREIPPLHLLKMKMVNFCKAYENSGLLHIIKYMMNQDDKDDITKLIGIDNIRFAVRHMHRIALSFCLAMQILYIQQLPADDAADLIKELQCSRPDALASKWDKDFQQFLDAKSEANASFQLHCDMMRHACEIVGINLAERIGGPKGYDLLRGCLKSSLSFSFLNGASSYAPYSTSLLADHCSAPALVQGMKSRFFSVPYAGSQVNLGLDTVREEEHRKCKKYFRPRSTTSVIETRMKRMEEVNAMQDARSQCLFPVRESANQQPHPNWKITDRDVKYIIRGASLIVRRDGLLDRCEVPFNLYTPNKVKLSSAILDRQSQQCGEYLVYKHCSQEGLFDITKEEVQHMLSTLEGPSELVKKVKGTTSTTVRRSLCKPVEKSAEAKKTEQRTRKLEQEKKKIEGLFSKQNTCQAIVNTSCQKYKVTKSLTVPKAIIACVGLSVIHRDTPISNLESSIQALRPGETRKLENMCHNEGLVCLNMKHLDPEVAQRISVISIENAGAHYKSGQDVKSGVDFIRHFQDRWITRTVTMAPNVRTICLSEEKYNFTPDLFKGATRSQRKTETSSSIAHLRTDHEMISEQQFSRSSVVGTGHGKVVASTFISKNVHKLSIRRPLQLVLDSEHDLVACSCENTEQNSCTCDHHAKPILATFDNDGLSSTETLSGIKQRKGEAECAQLDWIVHYASCLSPGEVMLSIVTSADIDSVVLHLFALSDQFPRNENGTFKNDAYVMLQKTGHFDLYNITGMLMVLEKAFHSRTIGKKLAMILCLGGNDFIPKFHGITHLKVTQLFLSMSKYRDGLFSLDEDCVTNHNVLEDFLKALYCPKSLDVNLLTYEEVRQLSIRPANKTPKPNDVVTFNFMDGHADLRHPKLWLPPATCVRKLSTLYDAMFKYMIGLGHHDARLPDFKDTCLVKTTADTTYDFGPEAMVSSIKDLLVLNVDDLLTRRKNSRSKKRSPVLLPEKDLSRKRKRST